MGQGSGLTFLQAFINEIDGRHLLQRPNPNMPQEIHFFLGGHAGFGVDISAWGSFQSSDGFLGMVVDYDDVETQVGQPLQPLSPSASLLAQSCTLLMVAHLGHYLSFLLYYIGNY